MPDFDLTRELSLKIELHMLRPITKKVHSGNGPVSLVLSQIFFGGLFEFWKFTYLLDWVRQEIPMLYSSIKEGVIGLALNPRNSEIVRATPGNVMMKWWNTGKIKI